MPLWFIFQLWTQTIILNTDLDGISKMTVQFLGLCQMSMITCLCIKCHLRFCSGVERKKRGGLSRNGEKWKDRVSLTLFFNIVFLKGVKWKILMTFCFYFEKTNVFKNYSKSSKVPQCIFLQGLATKNKIKNHTNKLESRLSGSVENKIEC